VISRVQASRSERVVSPRLLVVVVTALMALAACSSSRSEQDQAFLTSLGVRGDAQTQDSTDLIKAGHALCDGLPAVKDPMTAITFRTNLLHDYPIATKNTDLATFTSAATSSYCPDVAAAAAQRYSASLSVVNVAPTTPAVPTPTSSPTPTTTECVGYGCSAKQDAQINKGEASANPGVPADAAAGCAAKAMAAGKFDPSCREYQGYLDPGQAGGRQPNSAQDQTQYGCEKGYIPKDQC